MISEGAGLTSLKIVLLPETLPCQTFSFIEVHLHLKSSDGVKLILKIDGDDEF